MNTKFITGFVFGAALSVCVSALAVNYSRDIAPLKQGMESLERRVANLEFIHSPQ